MHASRKLAVLVFPDVELLDFCGPYEVFSVANRQFDVPPFELFTVAETAEAISARNGLSFNPDYSFETSPTPQILLVSGGRGTRREMHNARLLDWVRQSAQHAELVLSVCTGALLLAKAGLLDGLEATTHHAALDLLREVAPRTRVREDRRVVDNGKIVTSAGIATGMDLSLHVVGRLLGQDVAAATARHMAYPWQGEPAG